MPFHEVKQQQIFKTYQLIFFFLAREVTPDCKCEDEDDCEDDESDIMVPFSSIKKEPSIIGLKKPLVKSKSKRSLFVTVPAATFFDEEEEEDETLEDEGEDNENVCTNK